MTQGRFFCLTKTLTGIEPVEASEAVEPAETGTQEMGLNITFTSGNVIKSVTYDLYKDSTPVFTNQKFDSLSANVASGVVTLLSTDSITNSVNKVMFTNIELTDAYDDNEFKVSVSGDGIVAEVTAEDATNVGALTSSAPLNVPFPLDGEMYIKAEPTVFDGTINLEVVSADIIKKVKILSSNKAGDNIQWTAAEADTSKNKTITFTRAKDFSFEIVNADGYRIEDATMPSTAYSISFNGTGIEKDTYSLGDTKKIELSSSKTNITARFEAKPEKDYNKKGNLTLKVSSENTIGGKTVSIGQVNIQLREWAIKWNGTDAFIPDTGVSANTIKTQDQQIVIPYEYAKDATITVVTDQGNNDKHTRYAYTIDDGKTVFYQKDADVSAGEKKSALVDLGATNTTLELKVKQVAFDPSVTFDPVSNNILKSFKVYYSDGKTEKDDVVIDASKGREQQTKVFKDAKKITFKASSFTDPTVATAESDPKGWVYRIEYDGKVQKTFVPGVAATLEDFDIKVDANGNLPSPITVSAIPNVKITLSANDSVRTNKDDVWTTSFTYEVENGATQATRAIETDVLGVSKYFYVEPGKVVSVDGITATKPYLFPYINGAEKVFGQEKAWTLGSTEQDKTFDVDVKEFAVWNADKYALGNALTYTQVGNGSLSVDLVSNAVALEGAASKTCSGNYVFSYSDADTPLNIQFKLTGDDAKAYNIERISYKYWAGNGYKTFIDKDVDVDINGHAIVGLSANFVRDTLIKDDKINVEVRTNELSVSYNLIFSENNSGSVAPTVTNGGVTIVDKISETPKVDYGSNLVVKTAIAAGYKLVSVNIIEADKYAYISGTPSENKITNITDAKKLAEFTGKGYSHTMGKETRFEFNTAKIDAVEVVYADSKEVTLKSNKYQVNHKRPVVVTYINGSDAVADGKYNYSVMVGKDSVSSNAGITKTSGKAIFTIDGTKGELAGKTLVFKFWTGDGSSKDSSVKTVTLVIDGEDTGVTFKNEEEKMDVGSTKTISATVKGTINAKAIVKGGAPTDMDLSFENGKLTVKTTAKTPKGTYEVTIVDKDATTVEYGKVKVTLTYDSITNAPKPIVKVTNTTNRRIFLSLKQNKLDTKIDGLYYKIYVKTGKYTKNLFASEKTMYVPIDTTNCYVDMFKNDLAGADLYDGDDTAEFKVTVTVVQGHTPFEDWENNLDNKRKVITTLTENGAKGTAETADAKAQKGSVFASKISLKKVSKGNPMTNMNATNPFVISIGYDKNCQVQQIDHIEILNKNGEDIKTAAMYDLDDYTIKLKPNAGLGAGTYTIKAYALEPTSVAVVGQMKINVKQAIHALSVEGATDVIYKIPGTKAVAEFTAFDLTGTTKETKKVDWFIVKADDTDKVLDFGKDIVLKNGKLTVKKDYVIPKEGVTFKIKVKAKDYAANYVTADTTQAITIKGAPELALNLAFTPNVKKNNFVANNLNDLESSYTVKDLFGPSANEDDKYEYVTYVAAYDKAKTAGAVGHYVPAKFKVSGGAKLLGVYNGTAIGAGGTRVVYAKIGLNKLGKFKLTVTPTDGSADKKFAPNRIITKEVTVTAGGTLGYTFSTGGVVIGSAIDANAGKSVSVNNYQAEGDAIFLKVLGYAKDAEGTGYDASYINHKVSVKGGKLTKYYKTGANDYYKIEPNDTKTVVTLTNTDTKVKFDVTVTNYAIGAKNVKSDVVASNNNGINAVKGQIWSYLKFDGGAITYEAVSYNKVTYQVTKGGGEYVLVSVIKDDTTPENEMLKEVSGTVFNSNYSYAGPIEAAVAKVGTKINNNTYAIKLDSGKFVIDYGYTSEVDYTNPMDLKLKWNAGKFNIKPGTYKINVTPAKKDGANYVAVAKTKAVNVSAKKAPKASVKPKATVEWDNTKHQGTVPAGNYKNYITSGKVTFTGVLDTNTKGVYNNFKWKSGTNGNFTILDPDHADADAKQNTTGTLEFKGSKAISATAKSELQGWVTYKYQALDGTTETQNIKVTIKPAKGATEVK